MAKVFGLIVLALGVWVGVEIYMNGVDGAFGGALARLEQPLQSDGRTDADAEEGVTHERESLGKRLEGETPSDGDADAEDNN